MKENSQIKISPCKQGRIVFLGTPEFGVNVLEELKKEGIIPSLIITAPNKPKGRKLILTPPPVKVWAEENNIPVIQPKILEIRDLKLEIGEIDIALVIAYGKLIPKKILDIPQYGFLNVHPSLLPKFRGASPVKEIILKGEKETGTTIMLLDEELDHGPIIAQKKIKLNGKITSRELEEKLAKESGKLLAKVIPKWIKGEIKAQEQDHSQATYTKKIKKEDGLVDLEKDNPELIYRKFRAFQPWPGIYFFKNNKRVIIKEAEYKDNVFIIKKVLPESRRIINYLDFLR